MRGFARRIYGEPPAAGASRVERLRYVRRSAYYSNGVPLIIMLVLIAIWFSPPLNWILPVVFGGLWLSGLISLGLKIRRERGGG